MHFDDLITSIPGIGPKKAKLLSDAGYCTLEDLHTAEFFELTKVPGIGYKITCNLFSYIGKEQTYPTMIEVTSEQEKEFVTIENKKIYSWEHYKKPDEIKMQPKDFELERTTVWSFSERGDWSTHTPHYRGNWSPKVVRNIIERYSKPFDFVLDPMVGGGTTPVECILTGRNSISIDINPDSILLTRNRLNVPQKELLPKTIHKTFVGDTRNLDRIPDSSIDLIAAHPPYVNIIRYSRSVDGDLSQIGDYKLFFKEFKKAIKEYYRILKPGCVCAVLIGDTHNRGHFVPITSKMLIEFLEEGFILKEDVIKREWNCESDRYLKKYANSDFLLTMHEHLFIFRKPANNSENYKNSSISFFK